MQTLAVVLFGVFGTLLFLALAGGSLWLYVDSRRRQRELINAMREVSAECKQIAAAPAYLDGMVKIAADMVTQITKLTGAVDKFHASLFGAEEKRRDADSWKPYDETEADQSFEVEELVKAGFDRHEAVERVKAMAMSRNVEEAERRARDTFRLAR